MQRKKGNKYCSEHMQQDSEDRIPCPLDPKHTVWKKDLNKHVRKCNARPKDIQDPWFSLNCNHTLKKTSSPPLTAQTKEEIEEEIELDDIIDLVVKAAAKYPPLEYSIESHSGLDKRLSEVEKPKHPIQQSSLAGNLKKRGLLNTKTVYLEFGCGKAELLRFISLCCLQETGKEVNSNSNYGFGLIDRSVNRMKNDPKITKEAEQYNKQHGTSVEPQVKRTRIDIKDLDLDIFLEDIRHDNVTGISKHLCGVATDLTLRLLFNSQLITNNKFKGLMIAMCCRHICDYDLLLPLSQKHLKENGITTKARFQKLKKLVSWAVSGTRPDHNTHQDQEEYFKRQRIGLAARRLVDESRLYAIKEMLPENYKCDMFWYVEPDVTLENVCLCIEKI